MTLTKSPPASKHKVTAAAGKTVKRTVKPKAKTPKKVPARLLEGEQTRRANAVTRIEEAALAAGTQRTRIGIFMGRLQARIDRAVERVEKLVTEERGRRAKLLEKHPELNQLNGKPSLDDAAAIPDVEIPESELPSYITNIQPTDSE